MNHILRTPKRLQAAVSKHLAGGTTTPVALLLASFLPFQAPVQPDLRVYDLRHSRRLSPEPLYSAGGDC